LSGGEAEPVFFGADEGSKADYATARKHLAQRFSPLRIGVELERHRDAARRLVTSAWAQDRIRLIADALLRCGVLSNEQIYELT
jgi:hypothetical protein